MLPRPFSLWRKAAPAELVIEDRPESFPEACPAVPIPPAPTPKSRVLLLDDREDFREVVADFLGMDYTVTAVANGAEGLREIMKDTFDLIVCDMMMPQVGGEMFYWAVTRVRPAAGLRFIFITGHRQDPRLDSFFQRIGATVLIKPFPLSALSAAMREVTAKLR